MKWSSLERITHYPVSVCLILGMWVSFILLRITHIDASFHLHNSELGLRLLSSGLSTTTLRGLVVVSVLAAVCLPVAEKALGPLRFLFAVVISHIVGVGLGLTVAEGLSWWPAGLHYSSYFSPLAWIIGPIVFAAGGMQVLWRRRIRALALALSLVLVLYSGSLIDITVLSTVVVASIAAKLIYPPRTPSWRVISIRESRILVALVMTAVALGPLLAALNPQAAAPFSGITRLIWQPALTQAQIAAACQIESEYCHMAQLQARQHGFGALLANLMPFAVQLLIALGLVRGRRIAWYFALFTQLATMVILALEYVVLQTQFDSTIFESLNLSLTLLPWIISSIVLLFTYRRFKIPSTLKPRFFSIVGLALGGSAALWLGGAWLGRRNFQPALGWEEILTDLPYRYLPTPVSSLTTSTFVPDTTLGWLLFEWPGIVFWFSFALSFVWLIQTVPDQDEHAHQLHAQQLLRQGSGDHISWMTQWAGNRYWFHADSYVAYRFKHGVALTLGQPVTAIGVDPQTVAAEFEVYASTQGWQVAWYSVNEEFALGRKQAGFKLQQVAEEAILDTTQSEFKGKKFQNIRTARNNANKQGIYSRWVLWSELDMVEKEQIIALSEEWLSQKSLPEMGFTLGTVAELSDSETKLLLAYDQEGTLHGVTSWLPVYQEGQVIGYTLDFMRRSTHGFKAVIEFLISEAVLVAQAEGKQWISLSGAPLATPQPEHPNFLESTLEFIARSIEPLYGFRSLAASKNKFQPEHGSWYLCYNDELLLGSIAVAVCSSYLPTAKLRDVESVIRVMKTSH